MTRNRRNNRITSLYTTVFDALILSVSGFIIYECLYEFLVNKLDIYRFDILFQNFSTKISALQHNFNLINFAWLILLVSSITCFFSSIIILWFTFTNRDRVTRRICRIIQTIALMVVFISLILVIVLGFLNFIDSIDSLNST